MPTKWPPGLFFLPRVPEPEIMGGGEEAEAYSLSRRDRQYLCGTCSRFGSAAGIGAGRRDWPRANSHQTCIEESPLANPRV